MKAGDFARRRARIECDKAPHGRGFQRKALRALVKRTGAALIVPNGKRVGYRLPDGSVACEKHRYRSRETADAELARIAVHASHAYIPVRAYRCEWCDGWHLTSRA